MTPNLRRAAVFGAAALALWLIGRNVAASGFDPGRFLRAFATVDLHWTLAAVALGLATYWGRAVRWAVLLRPLGSSLSLIQLTKFQLIGFSATLISGRAGEMVRPYLIARAAGVSFGSQVALWVVERLLDLLSVLVIFSLALAVYRPPQDAILHPAVAAILQTGGRTAAVGSAIILLLLPLAGLAQVRINQLAAHLPKVLGGWVRSVTSGFAATGSAGVLRLSVAYSLAEWGLIAACYYCVFRSFPPAAGIGPADTLVVLGFVSFGSVIQLPAVGGGMQVAAVLVLSELYGLSNEDAAAAALLLWVIGFALAVPLGLFLAVREGWNWSRIKSLAREAAAPGPAAG